MNKRQSGSFLAEALIISVSNLVVKIIGVAFRIPLTNMLQGATGIYTAAFSVYAMLYMVSTSGLPVAISRMVSSSRKLDRKTETKRIFRSSMLLFGAIGLICTLVMFFGADSIARSTKHADAALAMRIISPTLFLICVSSALRGYFQGLRNMVPTAVSQFIEALCKLVLGLGAAQYAITRGYSPMVQAAFAISGITIGTVLAMTYMIIYKYFYEKRHSFAGVEDTDSYKDIYKNLLKIAVPVTITSSALYFSQFLDTLVINRFLINSGVDSVIAEDLYTSYTGLTLSISDLLPATLIFPIAISILPAVSGALAVNDQKQVDNYIHSSIRISGIIALPCAFGMLAVSRPAIALIYGTNFGSGADIVRLWNGKPYMPIDIASNALMILSVGIIFISLLSTTNALLQAVNRQYLPMISIGVGVIFLVGFEIGLVSVPSIGIYGSPVASVICYIAALSLNMLFLKKYRSFKISIRKLFFKPFVCAAACGAAAYGVVCLVRHLLGGETRLNSLIIICAAGAVGVIVYVVSMLAVRGITADEVRLLPKGRTLCGFLLKKGFLKE
ncbi:MAG: polysaccharide biosynthesis protein [Eubacteriales bacterium]|nr:polysaccharide biosynthesis protein [Eubacteriales bacterium]